MFKLANSGQRISLLAAGLVMLFGCSPVAEDAVEGSGFLADYSHLQEGDEGKGQARLRFIDPDADFSGYRRVIVDPVVVWNSPDSRISTARRNELKALADSFDASIRRQLEPEFPLTDKAATGTLRIRMAITEVGESSVEIECEILDSITQQRLVAVVDERDWSQASRGSVEQALDHWAVLLGARLSAFRDFDTAQKLQDAAPAN